MNGVERIPSGHGGAELWRSSEGVHRTTGPWTPTVQAFLVHLERVGFGGAPRLLWTDEAGREILTFVEGDVLRPDLATGPGLHRLGHHPAQPSTGRVRHRGLALRVARRRRVLHVERLRALARSRRETRAVRARVRRDQPNRGGVGTAPGEATERGSGPLLADLARRGRRRTSLGREPTRLARRQRRAPGGPARPRELKSGSRPRTT